MHVSVRSYLTAGVATVTAATLAFVPSVAESAPQSMQAPTPIVRASSAPFRLAAAVQPTAPLPGLLTDWLQSAVVPSSAPAAVGASVDSAIKNVYDAVEPWVRYGFEVATYVVGWVPVVGWLAPQIMIFYNFGERIARSVTFNVADFLGGNVGFVQGVGNVAVDTINSFITLANDELAFFLPPLPPIPPIGALAAAEPSVLKVADVEAPAGVPAVKRPLADLAALATEVDEHVQALTKATLPRPRDAIRALEAALNPVRTDVTKDPGTETTTDPARTPPSINKFVKRLTAPSRRPAETASDDASAQPSKTKPRHARKHATESSSSDGSAPTKANASKDRGPRGARHVKAGAKD
ncbi:MULTISPECIES: hypothetical protein [unclassified Mycobacterium]|uniref:hypothetical protein n=1 Tax=unclassified Mycobacterium TaxID=2642494 RepID=UPI0029C8F746|nr:MULTISPECIES: hypothetical protein [unclassified Mycobacterium]